MKNNPNQSNSTQTKAFRELKEVFELQTKRIMLIEQQFMDLSIRVNNIEDSKLKVRPFV